MDTGQVVGSSSFAGAWRRVGAFLVDAFLLGLAGAAGRTTYLAVVAYLDEPRIDDETKATRLARLALEADPSAMNVDVVQVSLVYGYDIGIASGQRSMAHRNTPAGWISGTEVTH